MLELDEKVTFIDPITVQIVTATGERRFTVPVGTVGTVVHIHNTGSEVIAYEVDINQTNSEGERDLITVNENGVESVQSIQ